MKKKNTYKDMKCWREMHSLVWDEFHDISRNGLIVITYEEMTNVFINLLADFMKMQKEKQPKTI